MKTLGVHIIQSYPPSCLNADGAGIQKTAVYGGATRLRLSSQSQKRPVREYLEKSLDQICGKRTRVPDELVKDEILALQPDMPEDKALSLAKAALAKAVYKSADKKGNGEFKSGQTLAFISPAQAKALAGLTVEGCEDKARYKDALKKSPSLDQILFGRMFADDPSLDYDACVQVAHALSTHNIELEDDYYLAVDDCQKDDSSGAAFIDTQSFGSATVYRYAAVNLDRIKDYYGVADDTVADAVAAFIEAFVKSGPTGKKNSFLPATLPSLVYLTITDGQPVSLAGAFEKPVDGQGDGYVDHSIKALGDHIKDLKKFYNIVPIAEYVVFNELPGVEKKPESLNEVLDDVRKDIKNLEK